jgi:hypothetical protein
MECPHLDRCRCRLDRCPARGEAWCLCAHCTFLRILFDQQTEWLKSSMAGMSATALRKFYSQTFPTTRPPSGTAAQVLERLARDRVLYKKI